MNSIHEIDQRFVIIHGHFYQPPRENPWLGFIERQESASPFRNWTERITEECYRSNAFSPLLARGGRISGLVNNFEHLSFNVGPTLLDWLEPNAPDVYRRIIDGDRQSAERLGHGNAIAQGYNHAILPLCNRRDKRTQILWGLEDFQRRFGRRSEGIWLPETAVDLETVEVLIACGVAFVILAPSQLKAIRPLDGSGDWETVPDPGSAVHHQPYRIFGRDREAGHLDVFFFHPDLSREISFDHLLRDGRTFSRRLGRAFDGGNGSTQAVVVATDGETFGHHEQFGNMCLSWVFNEPPKRRGFRLTNFGRFLSLHPPEREARLQPGPDGEGTAWSCAHGVGRWARDCGCSTGAEEGWDQQWRTPLRNALNRLRDRVDTVLEREGTGQPDGPAGDFRKHPPRPDFLDASTDDTTGTDPGTAARAYALNELHYYSQLMFTSCGWFFNDINGLEPVQNFLYARRVVELLERRFGEQAEQELLETLKLARSNVPGGGSGARIYRREVIHRSVEPSSLVAAAALLRSCGVNQPLGRHGEQWIERVATERINKDSISLEAGWSRLRSRVAPLPRLFLHLIFRSDAGARAWAEEIREKKAESAFKDLLDRLDRSSENDIRDGYPWCVHPGKRLPTAFRERLETWLRDRQDEETTGWMQELLGTGRELFLRASRDRKSGSGDQPSSADKTLCRLFGERVEQALARGGRKAHRPARGMLRMARALDLPLDRSAGAAAVQRAICRQLELPGLFHSAGTMKQALKVARLAVLIGLDPAENRLLQIQFWELLENCLNSGGPAPEAATGTLRLAERLGFHRRSLEKLIAPSGDTDGPVGLDPP